MVLDVACGNGNATFRRRPVPAPRALGIDYVSELLEGGRGRAMAEGLDVEFRPGDAEDLPVPDTSFDAVLSVFGAMFAPDHQRAAAEIIRVTRPGGTVGLASWTPGGFIGEMFGVIARHVPGPPGVASPMLWGTEEHLSDLFGPAIADARSVERTCTWRFTSAEEFVAFFRRWYGPTLKAFEAAGTTAAMRWPPTWPIWPAAGTATATAKHRHPGQLPRDRPDPPLITRHQATSHDCIGHPGHRRA